MWKDPITGEMKNGLKQTNYTHDALIDLILANPAIDQRQLAAEFGYSEGWISLIMSSDSFQAALAKRKEEVIDPAVRASLDAQLKGLVHQSIQVLRRKLEANPSDDLALTVMTNASRALGYGAKVKVEGTVNHNHSLIAVLSSLPQGPAPRVAEKVLNPLPEPKLANG